VKRFKFAAFFLLTWGFSCAVHADFEIDSQNFGSENITEPTRQTPFNLDTKIDFIGKTKITNGHHRGDHFHFAQLETELGGVFYYVPQYTEGANLSFSYSDTYIHWKDNPYFDQHHFRVVSVALGAFTKRVSDWFWRGQLSINFDTKKLSAQYVNYDLVFWGRYAFKENIGFHFGFYAQTGMRMERVYPIFGADWLISPKWKLNLVFPMNVSVEYYLTRYWSLAIGGRSFNSRYRVGPHESSRKSLIRYENTGLEFIVKFENQNIAANLHAGTTLGGQFRVANKKNHNPHHYDLDPSGYVGGEIEVTF
jgi:Domain of unknown function (DUF6268)